jgi:hypothetical protein
VAGTAKRDARGKESTGDIDNDDVDVDWTTNIVEELEAEEEADEVEGNTERSTGTKGPHVSSGSIPRYQR